MISLEEQIEYMRKLTYSLRNENHSPGISVAIDTSKAILSTLEKVRDEQSKLDDYRTCEQCGNDTETVQFCAKCWNALAMGERKKPSTENPQ